MPVSVIENASFGNSGIVTANGIKFPATQVASANANTLDDYEEGTWTPTDISGAGLTFTQTGVARYIKVGTLVYVSLYIDFPGTSSSATVLIGGLPFTSVGSQTYSYLSGRAGSLALSMAQVSTGATNFNLFKTSSSTITNSELSGTYLILSGCYYAAS